MQDSLSSQMELASQRVERLRQKAHDRTKETDWADDLSASDTEAEDGKPVSYLRHS